MADDHGEEITILGTTSPPENDPGAGYKTSRIVPIPASVEPMCADTSAQGQPQPGS
jgi:hypothetical protein